MSISADTLKRLAALQLAPEAMQEVLSIISSCIEPLEERRRRDRDRKQAVRGKSADCPQNIQGNSADSSAEIPRTTTSAYIEDTSLTTKTSKKEKKDIHAHEIPDRPTDEAVTFAGRQGWNNPKIDLEWQRFRDHSLSKGRKHRDLLAAWRNWVRSPYQTPGGSNGSGPAGLKADKSVSGAADRILERLRDLDSPGEPH